MSEQERERYATAVIRRWDNLEGNLQQMRQEIQEIKSEGDMYDSITRAEVLAVIDRWTEKIMRVN